MTDPEFPEFPESPELLDVAEPDEVAAPVSPELALPELATVAFPEPEVAVPPDPPSVVEVEVEFPELPEVEPTPEVVLDDPVSPDDDDVPLELVLLPVSSATSYATSASLGVLTELLTLWELLLDEPLLPEPLLELLVVLAAPVEPVSPEVVWLVVLALPPMAPDDEVELVVTDPLQPPLPDEPLCALGSLVLEPEDTDPVDPVLPLAPTDEPSMSEPEVVPESPELPESPEFVDPASPAEVTEPLAPPVVLPESACVTLLDDELPLPPSPPSVSEVVVESPELPEVDPTVEVVLAPPVSPEVDPVPSESVVSDPPEMLGSLASVSSVVPLWSEEGESLELEDELPVELSVPTVLWSAPSEPPVVPSESEEDVPSESGEDEPLTSLAAGALSAPCWVLPAVSPPLPGTNSGEGPLELDPSDAHGAELSDCSLPSPELVPLELELFPPPELVPPKPELVGAVLFPPPLELLPCDAPPLAPLVPPPETEDFDETEDSPAGVRGVTVMTSLRLKALGAF